MATLRAVQELVVEQLHVDLEEVTPEATFREALGADSLDQVEMVMAMEEKFGLTVSDKDAEKFVTVGDVVRYLDDQGIVV